MTDNVIIDDNGTTYYKCKLMSIDAWRDGYDWLWNDMHTIEDGIYIAEDSDLLTSPRKLLKYFRDNLGVLTDASKGKVWVDYNGDIMDGLMIGVIARGTNEPLFVLSSIH